MVATGARSSTRARRAGPARYGVRPNKGAGGKKGGKDGRGKGQKLKAKVLGSTKEK